MTCCHHLTARVEKYNSCLKLQQRPLVGKVLFCHAVNMQIRLNVIGHIPGHEPRGCHDLQSYPVKFSHKSAGAELTSLVEIWGNLFHSRGRTTVATRCGSTGGGVCGGSLTLQHLSGRWRSAHCCTRLWRWSDWLQLISHSSWWSRGSTVERLK